MKKLTIFLLLIVSCALRGMEADDQSPKQSPYVRLLSRVGNRTLRPGSMDCKDDPMSSKPEPVIYGIGDFSKPIVVNGESGIKNGHEERVLAGLEHLYNSIGYYHDGGTSEMPTKICYIDTTILEENIAVMLGGNSRRFRSEPKKISGYSSPTRTTLTIQVGECKKWCLVPVPSQAQRCELRTHLKDTEAVKRFLHSAFNPSRRMEKAPDDAQGREAADERVHLRRKYSLTNILSVIRNLKEHGDETDVWAAFREKKPMQPSARVWQEIVEFHVLVEAVQNELLAESKPLRKGSKVDLPAITPAKRKKHSHKKIREKRTD